MLAISFALALVLHEPPIVMGVTAQAAANVEAATQQTSAITLIPFGQAFGSYDAGSGHMLALLEDAAGTPVWVLDAYVHAWGGLDGDLLPLEYASNPVTPGLQLKVSGGVVLDERGNGSFAAVIFQYNGGAIPVFPVGKLEGVIQQTAPGLTPPIFAGVSDLVAVNGLGQAYGPQLGGGGIIVCPKGPLAGIEAKRSMQQAGFAQKGLGQSAATGALGHQATGGVIECPIAPVGGVQSMGALAQAGFAQKGGSGMPPIVDPALASAAGVDGSGTTGAVAKREGAEFVPDLLCSGLARVALRWWLDN